MSEFVAGAHALWWGMTMWRRRPRAMAAGLVPALIVAAALTVCLVALGFAIGPLAEFVTPFADGWAAGWVIALRVAVGAALFGGAALVAVVSFTALTLLVGDPFYERIWHAAEEVLGGGAPESEPGFWRGFWRGAGDSVHLIIRGVLAGACAALLGFVPVVGTALGAVTGVVLTGMLLADELTSRALAARGIERRDRRMLRRRRRARVLGFGVVTQLCFLVPLGAVLVMPVAVAGATALARDLLAADRRHDGILDIDGSGNRR